MSARYFSVRKISLVLPVLLAVTAWPTVAQKQIECTQGSTCVSVNNDGHDPMSTEQARQSKQQWDDNKKLRHKKNTRAEKDFDKQTNAIDSRDNCTKSTNVNAYWEPNSERCLDRRTGQLVRP